MTEETKEEITVLLDLLKNSLINNGVSIALQENNIMFFDTDEYFRNHSFKGMKVNINDLVK